jgi:hypothetical protein
MATAKNYSQNKLRGVNELYPPSYGRLAKFVPTSHANLLNFVSSLPLLLNIRPCKRYSIKCPKLVTMVCILLFRAFWAIVWSVHAANNLTAIYDSIVGSLTSHNPIVYGYIFYFFLHQIHFNTLSLDYNCKIGMVSGILTSTTTREWFYCKVHPNTS